MSLFGDTYIYLKCQTYVYFNQTGGSIGTVLENCS